jgi:hypothetical protein
VVVDVNSGLSAFRTVLRIDQYAGASLHASDNIMNLLMPTFKKSLMATVITLTPFFAVAVQAATITWPSIVAPCNATLQACVDAVPSNSIVLIAINSVTAVTPSGGGALNISRPLTLTAAPGFRPVFPVGTGIYADPVVARSVSGIVKLELSGFTLREAAVTLRANRAENLNLQFVIERLKFLIDQSHAGSSSAIDFEGRSFALFWPTFLNLIIRDNEYLRRGGPGSFVRISARTTDLSGDISFNRVRIPDSVASDYGIHTIASGDGSLGMVVAHNEIRGSFVHGAICGGSKGPPGLEGWWYLNVIGNVLTPTTRGIGIGICAEGGEIVSLMYAAHNTIIDLGTASH